MPFGRARPASEEVEGRLVSFEATAGEGGEGATHTTDKDDCLETLTKDGDERQEEERPLGPARLALVLARQGRRVDLVVERAGELGLPLELGAVDAEPATVRGSGLIPLELEREEEETDMVKPMTKMMTLWTSSVSAGSVRE